jgi:O-antigen ligase
MEYLLVIALIPLFILGYRVLRVHPEWGVVLGLIPSVFFTEDIHENFFITDESLRIQTFDSLKVAGFFRPTELIILLLLIVLIKQFRKHKEQLQSNLNREIILLLVLCPIAGVLSALRGADPVFALSYHSWRTFWWASVFFFYCLYALDPKKTETYFRIFYFAVLVRMVYGVTKYLLGFGETHNVYIGTPIVFWDGMDLHLASAMAVISVVLLFDKYSPLKKNILILGILISTFAIMFSLRRAPIANVVFAFVAIFLFFSVKNKRRLLGGLLIAFLIALIVLGIAGGGGQGASTDIVLTRIEQVFATDLATEHEFHYFDPIDQLMAILKQPILGLGFGMPFERTFLQSVEQETTFSHDAYLFVWGGMGIVGLIVYLLLYVKTIRLTRSLFSSLEGSMFPIALVAIILTGLVQGVYSTTSFTSSRMPFVLFFATSLLVKLNVRVQERTQVEKQTG